MTALRQDGRCGGTPGKPGMVSVDREDAEHRVVGCGVCPGCPACRRPCKGCGGNGEVYGEREIMHYVTHEMALDAGEPTMEGMPMPERAQTTDICTHCNGTGQEPEDKP